MTPHEHAPSVGRRQWIDGALRYGAATGLAIVTGLLLSRQARRECGPGTSACRACARLSRCLLPPARATRGAADRQERL